MKNKKNHRNKIYIVLIVISLIVLFRQIVFLGKAYSSVESDIQYVSESSLLIGSLEKYTKLILAGIFDRSLERDIDRILERNYKAVYEKEMSAEVKQSVNSYVQSWEGLKVISHKYLEIENDEEKKHYMIELINYSEGLWSVGKKSMNHILNSSESKLSLLRTIIFSLSYNILIMIVLIIFFRMDLMEKLEKDTIFDPLTNAYNRRYLDEIILKEKSRVDRGAKTFSLIMCDIDHFKSVNDNFGHNVGDEVLVEFSRRIMNTIRKQDDFIRFGGEEFICFLRDTFSDEAMILAERIRKSIEGEAFLGVGKITASFGITEYSPPEDLKLTLERVDRALYDAKENGRNRSMMLIKPIVESSSIEETV